MRRCAIQSTTHPIEPSKPSGFRHDSPPQIRDEPFGGTVVASAFVSHWALCTCTPDSFLSKSCCK